MRTVVRITQLLANIRLVHSVFADGSPKRKPLPLRASDVREPLINTVSRAAELVVG